MRYALCELNDLPGWLWPIYREHPAAVSDVLVREMRWELHNARQERTSGYVLSRLRWSAKGSSRARFDRKIIQLLVAQPSPHISPLVEALTIILRDPTPHTKRQSSGTSEQESAFSSARAGSPHQRRTRARRVWP